jgi:hypothetical protein
MKTLGQTLLAIMTLIALCFLSLKGLKMAASHNTKINEFYSSTFYELRKFEERDYLGKEEQIAGELARAESGRIILRRSDGKPSLGLEVSEEMGSLPDSLLGKLVEVRVGRKLSRKSIGIYYYELRSVI